MLIEIILKKCYYKVCPTLRKYKFINVRKTKDLSRFFLIVGVDEVLVSSLVFKTMCAVRAIAGGFDSHALPPIIEVGCEK